MFNELLVKVTEQLDKLSVPYMIIGGQAVLLYGEPRFTRDIDITLGIDIDELHKIKQAIETLSLKPLIENVEDFVSKTRALPVLEESTGLRVDFVFSFIAFEREAIKRAVKIKIRNHDVKYASVEDLIVYKIVAGPPVDLDDVKNVVRKNPAFDKAYVKEWLKDFQEILNKPLLETFEKTLRE